MNERTFEFEWDDAKANTNVRKHGVPFELAADLEHSETEERWFSIGCASNGALLTVVYVWSETAAAAKIRLISARKATQTEIRYYQEGV